MTAKALSELRWNDHRAALWWLGLLYRRPTHFREALPQQLKLDSRLASVRQSIMVAGPLLLHSLPYILLLSLTGRFLLVTAGVQAVAGRIDIFIDTAVGVAVGIAGGITYGIAVGITYGIVGGIAVGIAVGITYGIAGGIAVGIAGGIAVGMTFTRAYYLPLHLWFVFPRIRGTHYRWHPVAWDDLCGIPFWRLDRLLVAYEEHAPEEGAREIERLISDYPTQRQAALRAKATLIARKAARADNLAHLDEIVAALPEGDKGFLGQTRRLKELVHEITALQARLDTTQRPVFRADTARLLRTTIENFQHKIAGFAYPLAGEFRNAAAAWEKLAETQLLEAEAAQSHEPTPQVFRAGDPVDRDREAFVPRMAIFEQLEQQVMLSSGCPGLLLYGRRRMGKSTILKNLTGFLPESVMSVSLSMQDPRAFISLDSLVRVLKERVTSAVPSLETLNNDSEDSLISLFEFFSTVNDQLAQQGRRVLVAFDEYENIDRKITEGVFSEDLLATLRESIQSHRNVTWVFAGSHEIGELSAPWASYLVSARTIEVPCFEAQETRLLLTEPLKYAPSRIDSTLHQTQFAPGFWGEGGIECIHTQTRGWPHLVQLVAESAIDLVNEENVGALNGELLERAFARAIVRGHNVLYELMRKESTLPGEWEYIWGFRTSDVQLPPTDYAIHQSLRRRQLVEEADGGSWRLRVPLMARWLRERG